MYPFERFSERAKKVLTLAQEEAERSHRSYIGTEHILLALLREGEGMAFKVLSGFGVEIEDVRRAIESIIGRDERMLIRQIVPTSRVKKVIELAFEEARRMGHEYVGTEHLLAGLLIEGEGVGARILHDRGVTIEKARSEIERQLTAPPAGLEMLAPERHREVMSAFPAGVVIVTAFGDDGLPRGLTVTAFAAVSLSPPLALVCIDRSSNTLPAVQHTGGFTANLLAVGNEELARRMATKVSDKFDGVEWRRSDAEAGGPILTRAAVAYAVCSLRQTIAAGDHWVLIGAVIEGAHNHDLKPMLYHRRTYKAF